jgi:hypothetical protein
LIIEEVDDDLLEVCGVDLATISPPTWLGTVTERLTADLALASAPRSRAATTRSRSGASGEAGSSRPSSLVNDSDGATVRFWPFEAHAPS